MDPDDKNELDIFDRGKYSLYYFFFNLTAKGNISQKKFWTEGKNLIKKFNRRKEFGLLSSD